MKRQDISYFQLSNLTTINYSLPPTLLKPLPAPFSPQNPIRHVIRIPQHSELHYIQIASDFAGIIRPGGRVGFAGQAACIQTRLPWRYCASSGPPAFEDRRGREEGHSAHLLHYRREDQTKIGIALLRDGRAGLVDIADDILVAVVD